MKKTHDMKLPSKEGLQKELGTRSTLVHHDLAAAIGLINAVCWQQLNYWINKDSVGTIFEDKKWVYNTYEQWQEQLPFLSVRTIRRSFYDLESMGLVLSYITKGNVKYYTIDYEALRSLLENDPREKTSPVLEKDISKDVDSTRSQVSVRELIFNQNDLPSLDKKDRIRGQKGQDTWTKRTGHMDKKDSLYIDTKITQRLHKESSAYAPVHSLQNAPPEKEKKISNKRGSKRGSSLDINWTLPDDWRSWSLQGGMMNEEIDMTELKFRNYWLSTTKNPTKKDWFRTWQNWCIDEYERKGIRLKIENTTCQTVRTAPIVAKSINHNSLPIRDHTDPKIKKWYSLQQKLKDKMGEAEHESWIERNLELISADGKAVFKASSNFAKDYISLRFKSHIAEVLAEIDPVLGKEENIELTVDGKTQEKSVAR